ncbi:Bug family tripartite tricarboxylate transporter substrate binding protein [Rhodoplanes sp. Z2-YC6860]|uniref:Bug family tripartite tricarboxylate transporter substrate binding protein n=1 Tax=Rhodoplanes sp. Z2-YC6860 TaxID=674703 RepID=UPI00078CC0B3|nr:tripartite tricarboxylate transporter substrate binding protein [Rhodoplanes sp. Z2-YC6860]AMN45251.1 TTT family tricarboxylate transporter, receptor protein [Rhodoplanes sp. Z2-YC6860]
MLNRTLAALVALSTLGASPVYAQSYPTHAVELVVPFAAGGGTDLLARLVAEGLSKRLGQSFVPLNRPGGNTNTGTLQVVKAAPDGYSLVMASIGLAANPSLYRKLAFQPLNDLAPITLIANSPTVLVVPPELPVNSLGEFLAYVKARPSALNYASYGAGSGPHLATELFRSMTGADIVHVPYSGGGPAAVGVMGNNVQMLFASILPVLGLVKSGKLKALAIASQTRSPLLPDVPTFREGGLDYVTGTWFGLLAPARTPDGIIAALHKSAVDTLAEPTVRERIAEQGAEAVGNTPAEFRAFLTAETERLATVIRNAKIQLD